MPAQECHTGLILRQNKVEYTDVSWLKHLQLKDSFPPLRIKTFPS